MSEEYLEKIFNPFTREENNERNYVQGTGLGMSIVKEIVELMGGNIRINSVINEGTEAIITLEFKRGFIESDSRDEEKSYNDVDLSKKRILLADDNELNREIISTFLSLYVLELDSVDNGAMALKMIASKDSSYYDMVLMDIQMPVMNGFDAAKKIRSFDDDKLSKIPIIAITANAFDEDRKRINEAEMDGFIAKPIELPALLEIIKKTFLEKE